MDDNKKQISRLFNIMKFIPLIIVILLIIFVVRYYDQITIENIVKFTPENTIAASVVLFALFAIKSIAIFFPIAILYGASGKMFPLPFALFINIIGLSIVLSIPYLIGKHYGEDLINVLYEKYPKTKKIDEFKNENEWFFIILTRIIKLMPGDMVSMLLGAMKTRFPVFLFFSLLVRIPPMVSNTFIGSSIVTKSYTGAIVSTIATMLISITSTYIFIKNRDKK